MSPTTQKLSGWIQRATYDPALQGFIPSVENFALVSFLCSIEEEQMIVAFFKPNIGIDKHGRVMKLKEEDFEGLVELAKRAVAGDTESKDQEWRMNNPLAAVWVEKMWVNSDTGVSCLSVCGFAPWVVILERGSNDNGLLPLDVHSILALVEEAKYIQWSQNSDQKMLNAVLDVVNVSRRAN